MGSDFQWPESMPDFYRTYCVTTIGEDYSDVPEQAQVRNMLFFYNQLDAGAFDDHQDKWILIDKETVIKITDEEDKDFCGNLDDETSAPISLPVDRNYSFEVRAAHSSRQGAGPSKQREVKSADTSGDPKPGRKIDAKKGPNDDEFLLKIKVRKAGGRKEFELPFEFIDPPTRKKYTTVMDTGAPNTRLAFDVIRQFGGVKSREFGNLYVASGYGNPNLVGDESGYLDKWVRVENLHFWETAPDKKVNSLLIGNDVLQRVLEPIIFSVLRKFSWK
ncbi:hypothetical protein BC938DRAFT_480636 [Jimgerdemannia flammicorona]|uniref:Peptidase A2 domain-containing protein n=1 Tax=Jimgerdemannia flammicorona TaxID=994334 RepID=A0A433QX69_9FUNG|nr:hypothetical protein BC938DRAFT_480636 [Jimgerdemannia flammicorona]